LTLRDVIPITEAADFSVSGARTLPVRKTSTNTLNKQLAWFDRTGKPLGQVGAPANYANVELSPDGAV
jgi:hypothetical protein